MHHATQRKTDFSKKVCRRRLLLMFVGLFVFGVAGCGFNSPADATYTNLKKYPELYGRWKRTGLVDHFPASIPPHATDPKMFGTYPGAFQGSVLQLRLTLPPKEIEDLEKKWTSSAKHRFIGGDTNAHSREKDGVPTTFNYTDDNSTFDSTFTILVLDAQDRGESNLPWNHGTSKGFAISQKHQVVIYWCELW